jgi:hypothetical protein
MEGKLKVPGRKLLNYLTAFAPLLTLPLLFIRDHPPAVSLRIIQIFSVPLTVLAIGSILIQGLMKTKLGPDILKKGKGFLFPYLTGRGGILIVFLITLTAVSLVRSQFVSYRSDDPRRTYLLTGDEPSYLLLTHSFVFDGDFNLANNTQDSKFFVKQILLDPGGFSFDYYNTISKGRLAGRENSWKDRQYFINRPALPILLSPAYWIGFHSQLRIRFAVLVWLNLFTAALAVIMLLMARSIDEAPFSNTVSVLFLVLTAPILYYSSQIYPDLPSALFVAGALLGLIKARRRGAILITGLLIACLPWFHERYLGMDLVLIGTAFFRKPFRRHPFYFCLLILLSYIFQGWYYWFFYGVPFPINSHKPLALSAIPRGLLALLTDRDKGLIFLNPLLLLVPVGLIPLWKENRWLAGTIIALLCAYLLPVAAFPDWHGGICPPLRYTVSIVPLLVLPLNALVRKGPWPLTRSVVYALGAWALWMGLKLATQPKLLFWKYGALFQNEAFHPAHILFPGYFIPEPGSVYRSFLWLGFVLCFPALDWLLQRGRGEGNVASSWLWAPLLLATGIFVISLISPLTRRF